MFSAIAESLHHVSARKMGRGCLHAASVLLFVYIMAATLSTLQGYVDNYKMNQHKNILCKKFGGGYCENK